MKNYESPKLEICKFEAEDIIMTSPELPTEQPGGGNNDLPFQPNSVNLMS